MSTSNSATKAVHALRCDLCECYLSLPPIAIISKDREKYRCGRCKRIPTEIVLRLRGVENVIKFFQFPCIYKNCKQELSWGEVEHHEEVCPHKTYRCNLENCADIVEIGEIVQHYKNKRHVENQIYYDQFQARNIRLNTFNVYVYIKNNIPFLIYIKTIPSNFWICVFCLKPNAGKNLRYKVRLSLEKSSDISLSYDGKKIISYDEREHCARCIIKKCHIKFHKTTQTTYPDFKVTKIHSEDVKKLSNSQDFSCKIDIIGDFGPGVQDNQVPKDTLLDFGSSDLVRQSLQCPICMEYMTKRIYTCNRGHAICNVCKAMLAKCPQCQGNFGETRNFPLETMAENVTLNCQYVQKGCNFVGNLNRLSQHEASCLYGN